MFHLFRFVFNFTGPHHHCRCTAVIPLWRILFSVGNNFQTQWLKQLSPLYRDKMHSAIVPTPHRRREKKRTRSIDRIPIWENHHYYCTSQSYLALRQIHRDLSYIAFRHLHISNTSPPSSRENSANYRTNKSMFDFAREKKNFGPIFAFLVLLPMMLRVCGEH